MVRLRLHMGLALRFALVEIFDDLCFLHSASPHSAYTAEGPTSGRLRVVRWPERKGNSNPIRVPCGGVFDGPHRDMENDLELRRISRIKPEDNFLLFFCYPYIQCIVVKYIKKSTRVVLIIRKLFCVS